jgi:hypothetical protein
VTYGQPDPMEAFIGGPPTQAERHVRLSALLPRARAKATYIYGMGDDWYHSIVLEKLLPRDPTVFCPVCLDGARACPPEGCGGVHGYYRVLEIVADPENDADTREDLIGEDYDPDAFSLDDVNRALQA